jgi:hypothetical protein
MNARTPTGRRIPLRLDDSDDLTKSCSLVEREGLKSGQPGAATRGLPMRLEDRGIYLGDPECSVERWAPS